MRFMRASSKVMSNDDACGWRVVIEAKATCGAIQIINSFLKLLSVFLELTAPAGEVIQYVPAAVLIRPLLTLNALFAIWTATTKIWRRPVQKLRPYSGIFRITTEKNIFRELRCSKCNYMEITVKKGYISLQ